MKTTKQEIKEYSWTECDLCEKNGHSCHFHICATCGKDICQRHQSHVIIKDIDGDNFIAEIFCTEHSPEKLFKDDFDAIDKLEEVLDTRRFELAEKCKELVKYRNNFY